MSNNQMVPVEKFLPVLANEKTDVLPPSVVSYGLIDHMHYSFSSAISDGITIHMEEAENASSKNGFVDIEFHDTVPESYKVYYAVAAASGVLTGALSFVKLTEEQLSKVEEWKEKNWKGDWGCSPNKRMSKSGKQGPVCTACEFVNLYRFTLLASL